MPASRRAFAPATESVADTFALTATVPTGAVIAAAWVLSGLTIALALHRRGHDGRTFAALGVVMGPLLLGFARHTAVGREREVLPLELRRPDGDGVGCLEVTVGLDGGPECLQEVLPIVNALAPRIRRLTVAKAVDFESATDTRWGQPGDMKSPAAVELEIAAALVDHAAVATVLVPGVSPGAVIRYAAETNQDLLVMPTSCLGRRSSRVGGPGAIVIDPRRADVDG
jgi:nucleotide-binding universal stress UspA family protein